MSLVMVSITAPRALEEALCEQLLEHPDWASGFTLWHAEGHGQQTKLSPPEQVRGRAARSMVQIVLEAGRAQELIAHLRERFPKPDVYWWIVPINENGRLA